MREYPRKGRGGLGVKTIQLTDAKGKLAGARIVRDGYQVMLISTGGTMIKMSVDEIKRLGRATQGVIVVRLKQGEIVSSLAPVAEPGDDSRGCRRVGFPASSQAPAGVIEPRFRDPYNAGGKGYGVWHSAARSIS